MKYNLKDLDVVYTLKRSNDNEEFRYSLRSLKNVPHKDVWVVGYKPDWAITNHISTQAVYKNKISNTDYNWELVASKQEISDPFILMNDDFFIMQEIQTLDYNYLCSNDEFYSYYFINHPNSYYTNVIKNTNARLCELNLFGKNCYELHTPMVIYKKDIAKALNNHDYFSKPVNIRTLVANIGDYGGEQSKDVKVYGTQKERHRSSQTYRSNTFISTDDKAFTTNIGRFIKSNFKESCKYEK